MTWTLTKHECPQELAQIMRKAWSMISCYTHERFSRALRMAWAMARLAAGRRLPPPPATLMQYLRERGGLRPCGELRHIGTPLHMLRRHGLALDDAARLASDAGYDVRDCWSRLLDMIRDEIFGFAHLALPDLAEAQELDQWAAHHADLLDAQTTTDCPF